ncbi:DUF6415 family natural product biosynthesis protein [Streptomyces sp. NRRL F-5135]|uniref:DUF6415 family natural product biosynthesis protein n=1 Tax=Streptomyces sp. NRRL F-5135 TaxID=1463858 RepID=UPI00068A9D9B|nr:DUF6415 family natural product biosynthesis protein [Streptomyces sp. NRRL F-5135]
MSAAPAPVTAEAVRAAIDRAEQLGRSDGTIEQLHALAGELRGHIRVLLPVAQAEADGLWKGGVEWYTLVSRLGGVRRAVDAEQEPSGLLAAHVRVQLLSRDCRWLLDEFGAALVAGDTGREAHRDTGRGANGSGQWGADRGAGR